MRLIDVDALFDSISQGIKTSDMPFDWYKGVTYATEYISKAPTIEPSGDLISRADAIEAIQTAYCKPCKESGEDYNGVRCRACDFDYAITQIDALPTADRQDDISEDGTLKVDVSDGSKVRRVLVCGDNHIGGLYYPDDRPTGEWIKTADGNGWNEWYVFKCPLCGATIEDKHYHSWKYNFCPNCGAHIEYYINLEEEEEHEGL